MLRVLLGCSTAQLTKVRNHSCRSPTRRIEPERFYKRCVTLVQTELA